MENLKQKALQAHKMWKGKVEVISRAKIENNEELSVADRKSTRLNSSH